MKEQDNCDKQKNEEEEEFEKEDNKQDKVRVLQESTEDGTGATFEIFDETHTLGNPLRHIIMQNEEVEFCGYSIPHPSENKLNIRIQTYGKITPFKAFQEGLDNLIEICNIVEDKFSEELEKFYLKQLEQIK